MGIIDASRRFLSDGLQNILTGLSGDNDPNSYASYFVQELSQQQIEASYRTSWLAQVIHDEPALDMTRAGREWKADYSDVVKLEAEERRLGIWNKLRIAETWSRLYGGSAMILGIGDDDMSQPLGVNRVGLGDLKYVHVMTRHQLTSPTGLILDPGDARYGEPAMYQVNAGSKQVLIHPSRVLRFVPKQMPDNIALSQGGWSDPLLMTVMSAIVNADSASGNFSALVHKSRTDTVIVPGLAEKATTQAGEQDLIKRFALLKQFESQFFVRILAGAKDNNSVGETWNSWQASFANIPEVQTMFWQAVAGASRYPLTRLIGMSPGGLNATGQSDENRYFEAISSGQEMTLRPRIEMLDEVLIRSALGSRSPDIWFEFAPLTVDSETTKTENALKRAQAIKALADAGSVPSEVLMAGTRGALIESGEYPGIDAAYVEYDRAGEVEPLPTETEAENDNALLSLTNRGVAVGDALAVIRDAEPRTLYVSRPVLNGEEIAKWYADQGVTGILAPEKMHVTIAYSKTPVDWMKVAADDWGGDPKLTVAEGGPRMNDMFGPESDTLVLMFNSSRLGYRHEEILRAGASWDWPDYQPHVSIAYGLETDISGVKPWTGPIEFGAERFEEVQENWSDD